LKFDARCSTGDIVRKKWELDTEGVLGGPFVRVTPAGVYNHNFGACSGQVIMVRLTVTDRDGRRNEVTQPYTLPRALRLENRTTETKLQTSMTSTLKTKGVEETVRGFVVLNSSRQDVTDNTGEFRHHFVGVSGQNTVEAFTASGIQGEAFWRFDFSGTRNFVSGSIAVVQGRVIAKDGYSVVFGLTGRAGERVGFTYRLSRQ
jgi:hypothetical protein